MQTEDLSKGIFSRNGKLYDIEECKKLIGNNAQLMNEIRLRSAAAAIIAQLDQAHILDINDLKASTAIVEKDMLQRYAERTQKELNSALNAYLSE